jgi:serine O-acetyltransferase
MSEVQSSIPTTIITSGLSDTPEELDHLVSFSSESLWKRLHEEALEALEDEPELKTLLHRTVLAPGVSSFEDAVAMTICFRLLQTPCNSSNSAPVFCPNSLNEILRRALLNPEDLELGHTMSEAVRRDLMAVLDRDPACDTLLEVVLFMKGFAALVCHRAARQKWQHAKARGKIRSLTALFLQSQASAVFAVDIHPAATIGAGVLLDHGTGVVIGETARVGDGCTLLHGVTLGGTGKDHGDRHPKIGPHVLIGAGATILGNINVGARAKIGAGSVVLKTIPAGATAVGAPAKIIGRTLETNPARDRDENLGHVGMLHKSGSMTDATEATAASLLTASEYNYYDEPSSKNEDGEENDDSDEEDDENNQDEFVAPEEQATTGRTKMKQRNGRASFSIRTNKNNGKIMSLPTGCTCPFRDYTRMALTAPRGTITIVSLQNVLSPEGCTSDEIGCTFFELDTRNVGYTHWDAAKDTLQTSLETNTRLSKERIETIVQNLEREHHESKKNTRLSTVW